MQVLRKPHAGDSSTSAASRFNISIFKTRLWLFIVRGFNLILSNIADISEWIWCFLIDIILGVYDCFSEDPQYWMTNAFLLVCIGASFYLAYVLCAYHIEISPTLIAHFDTPFNSWNYSYDELSMRSILRFYKKSTDEQVFNFRRYVIPFLYVNGAICLAFITYMIHKYYSRRRRARRDRLPRSALKRLKIQEYAIGDRWDTCSICIGTFKVDQVLRILPCNHAHHMECIDRWLLNNRRQCPLCKCDAFSIHYNTNEKSNDHTATEETPLIQPSNDHLVASPSTNYEIECPIINSSYDTTDNTNILTHSVIEHVNEIERDDNDEQML